MGLVLISTVRMVICTLPGAHSFELGHIRLLCASVCVRNRNAELEEERGRDEAIDRQSVPKCVCEPVHAHLF